MSLLLTLLNISLRTFGDFIEMYSGICIVGLPVWLENVVCQIEGYIKKILTAPNLNSRIIRPVFLKMEENRHFFIHSLLFGSRGPSSRSCFVFIVCVIGLILEVGEKIPETLKGCPMYSLSCVSVLYVSVSSVCELPSTLFDLGT